MSKRQDNGIRNAVFDKSHYKSFLHPLYNISHFCVDVKESFQRINRGYSDCDASDVDRWFIATVPNMLESYLEIGKKRKSFPAYFQYEIFNKHKDELDCTFDEYRSNYEGRFHELHDRFDTEAMEKWREIVEKMIFLFRESDEDSSSKHNPHDCSSCKDGKYWEAEKELAEYREKCKNQAFDLFSRYLWYLWE